MGDFSDDIFNVFDESATDPVPVATIEKTLPIKKAAPQPEEK
jgi:hypothetical protein